MRSAGRPWPEWGRRGSALHPPALTPTLSPPGDTRPLPARSSAYLPGLQLLREKWGQGQAEVREQAHGNGVERTRAICPPTPHRTHKRRQVALSQHAQGAAPRVLVTEEKPQGQERSLGPGGGVRECVQRCLSNELERTRSQSTRNPSRVSE